MIDPPLPPEAAPKPPAAAGARAPADGPLRIVVDLSSNDAPTSPELRQLGDDGPADKGPSARRTFAIKYRQHWESRPTIDRTFVWSREVVLALHSLQRETPDAEQVAFLTEQLRSFLHEHEKGPAFDPALVERALREGRRCDIVFQLRAHELLALPWEIAPVGGDSRAPLGQVDECSIQYEVKGTRTDMPASPPPEGGRVLVAWAGAVPAAEHLRAIRSVCEEASHPFDPAPDEDVVEEVSLSSLGEAMRRSRPAVLHLLCHGVLLPGNRAFGLALRGPDGAITPVAGHELVTVLRPFASSLRLVVLCACFGGSEGELHSVLGSVAQDLHELGIQSVIASRLPLSVQGSIDLASALYRSLLVSRTSLQDAFRAARQTLLRTQPRRYDWASLQLFARFADGPDLRPFVFRPYRGLASFGEADARYFVGREVETEEAVREITALLDIPSAPRFYAVVGGSGRGKSSFVAAGLLPRLKERFAGRAVSRGALQATVRPSAGLPALRSALAKAPREGLFFLVVDQLEEIFTSLPESDRKLYVDELWYAATGPDKRVLVLSTLRIDYLPRFGGFSLSPGRTIETILCQEDCRVVLGPIRGEEGLARVIEEPARKVGLTLQDGLRARIIEDAADEPGILPLIQFLLNELWQARSGSMLTLAAYERLGGLKKALQGQANSVLHRLKEDSVLAIRILVRLVAFSEDAARGTRRIVKLSVLRGAFERQERFDAVLTALVEGWLVVVRSARETADRSASPDSLVELAHEALIHEWELLRKGVLSYQSVRQELAPYQKMAESEGGILVGTGIRMLRDVIEKHQDEIDASVRALLQRSEEAERAVERHQRRHEHRVVGTALVAIVWAVATSVLWITNLREKRAIEAIQGELETQKERASESAHQARRESLVAGAKALVARGEPVWASKLLLEVGSGDETPGWVEVANEVLARRLPRRTLRGRLATFSADGQWVATLDDTARAVLVQRTDGKGAAIPLEGVTGSATGLAWSPDASRLASTSDDGTVRLWTDVFRTPRMRELTPVGEAAASAEGQGPEPARAPSFSADGRILTVIIGDEAAAFTLDGRALSEAFGPPGDRLMSALPGPDGRYLLLRTTQGRTEIWTSDPAVPCLAPVAAAGRRPDAARAAERPCLVRVLDDHAISAGWSADGWSVFAAHFDGRDAGKTDLEEDARSPLSGFGRVPGPIFTWSAGRWDAPSARADSSYSEASPGRWVDGAAWLDGQSWLLHRREIFGPSVLAVAGPGGRFTRQLAGTDPIAVSRDGQRFAATLDQTAWVTDTRPFSARVDLWSGSGDVSGIELDRSGTLALTSSTAENRSRLFSLEDPTAGLVLDHEDVYLDPQDSVVAGDGKHAVIEWDRGIFVWDLTGRAPATRLAGRVFDVSADGALVVTIDGPRLLVHPMEALSAPTEIKPGPEGGECTPTAVAFGTGKDLVFTCPNGSVWSADAASREPPRWLGTPVDCHPSTTPVLARAAKAVLFACGGDDVRVIRPSGETFLPPLCPEDAPWALAHDGEYAVCGNDAEVVILPIGEPDRAVVWQGQTAHIDQITVSPDSRYLRTSSADNAVRILSLHAPGEPLLTATHPQIVVMNAFSRSGDTFLTSSIDGWIRVWDLRTQGPPVLLRSGSEGTPIASLSSDGKRVLVSSSYGGTARLFSLEALRLRERLGAENTDCLPPEVRRLYLGITAEQATIDHEECERAHGR